MIWRRLGRGIVGLLALVGFATLSSLFRAAVQPAWGAGAVFIGIFVAIVLGVLIAYKMRDEELREKAKEQERRRLVNRVGGPDYANR
jgi:Na+/melibiose symporter-like transporter